MPRPALDCFSQHLIRCAKIWRLSDYCCTYPRQFLEGSQKGIGHLRDEQRYTDSIRQPVEIANMLLVRVRRDNPLNRRLQAIKMARERPSHLWRPRVDGN